MPRAFFFFLMVLVTLNGQGLLKKLMFKRRLSEDFPKIVLCVNFVQTSKMLLLRHHICLFARIGVEMDVCRSLYASSLADRNKTRF